jgi:hypothetical protein
MFLFRLLLVLILSLFIFTSDSSAGPIKRFFQNRKAAANCPCGVGCQCLPNSCPQSCPTQQPFNNPAQFYSFPGPCPNGVCPVPKPMPKLRVKD